MHRLNTHILTLQHTATHCNTLQHTATHCNILQHNATQLHEVGVPMDRLNKTIVTRPQILGCSVDKNLRPKLELLVEMAGIEREQLHQVRQDAFIRVI